MIRNRYKWLPHPALDIKLERNTYSLDGVKENSKSRKPRADGHQAILNKITKSHRQSESGRTIIIRINHNRSIALEQSAVNYWGASTGFTCAQPSPCSAWRLLTHLCTKTATYEPRHDKTNKVTVHPAKTRISLGIRPVWSESSLSAWRKLGSLATHSVHSEDSDQTGRMPRLIWVFAGHT